MIVVAFVTANGRLTTATDAQDQGIWDVEAIEPAQSTPHTPAINLFGSGNIYYVLGYTSSNPSNVLLQSRYEEPGEWTASQLMGTLSSSAGPALATFNGHLWLACVANNPSNQLCVSSSADGVNWTDSELVGGVGNPQSSSAGPALAVFKDRLWLACVANDPSNRLCISSSADGVNWTDSELVGGLATRFAPALAGLDIEPAPGLRLAYVTGDDPGALMITTSGDGINWSDSSPVANDVMPIPPGIVSVAGNFL